MPVNKPLATTRTLRGGGGYQNRLGIRKLRATGSRAHTVSTQCLEQIFDQIVGMFESDRYPQ